MKAVAKEKRNYRTIIFPLRGKDLQFPIARNSRLLSYNGSSESREKKRENRNKTNVD